jgi:hypothetical protein
MKLVLQPEGSDLCGQACVAMVAAVSLRRAIEATGHEHATTTGDVVGALETLGIECHGKLVRLSRKRPNIPTRAMVHICRSEVISERRRAASHWMVSWDGKIFDPGGRYPQGFEKWKITSFLEIK